TAADGTYRATRLTPSISEDAVCIRGPRVTGGHTSARQIDQCYLNVAWDGFSGVPSGVTPVPVTAGATASGKNAALGTAGAISGKVGRASGRGGVGNGGGEGVGGAGKYAGGTSRADEGR